MKNIYDLVIEMEAIEDERNRLMKSLKKNKATIEDLTKLEELEIKYNELDKIIIEKGIKFNVYKYKEVKLDLERWETMTGISAFLAVPRDYSNIRNEKKSRLALIVNDLKSIEVE